MRKAVVWLGAALLVAAGAVPAVAGAPAPGYVTSDPQNGATVSSPPDRVSVTFTEPLDSASTLQVFDQCGRAVDAGDQQVLGSRIDVGIAETPSGHYTAVYVARGFGGATGETKGSISFHVTSGEACDGGEDHGGHGGSDDPGDGGGGHDGHGNGNDHDGSTGGGHDDHDDGEMDASHHGDGDGSGHDDHGGENAQRGNGHGGGGHREGHGGGDHGGGNGRSATNPGGSDGRPQLASGRGGPGLAPTSSSVLIALGLSVAMGALGGWVLRVSAGS